MPNPQGPNVVSLDLLLWAPPQTCLASAEGKGTPGQGGSGGGDPMAIGRSQEPTDLGDAQLAG